MVKLADRPEDAERFFGGQSSVDEQVVVDTMTRDGWDLYEIEPRDAEDRERRLHFRRRRGRFKSDTHLVLGLGYGRSDGRTHLSVPSIDPTPVGKVIFLPSGLRFRFLGVTYAQAGGYDEQLLGVRSFPARGENQVVGVLALERIPDGVREIDLREAEFSDRQDSHNGGGGSPNAITISYRCGHYRDDGLIASGLRGDLVSTYPVADSRPTIVTSGDTRLPWNIDQPLSCEFLLFDGPHLSEFDRPIVRYPFTITPTEQSIAVAREQDQPFQSVQGARSWGSRLGVLMTAVVVAIFVAAVAGLASGRWNPAASLGEARPQPAPVVTPIAATAGAPSPSPVAQAPGPSEAGFWVEVGNTDGEGVYLRRTPTMADRLVAWPDGTRLEVIGADVESEGRKWKRVRDPSRQDGYVPEQYTVPARPR